MIHERRALERAIEEVFESPASAERQVDVSLTDRPSQPYSRKVTVKGLVEMPEWKGVFTESAVRALIDKARTRYSSRGLIPGNGLIEAGAIIRLNRKILIDCDRFRAWVESHRISHSASSGEYDHEKG